jgi:hypothetical protein
MLDTAGSIASLVGAALSLPALAFTIWYLFRVGSRAQAAQHAAEEMRRAGGRDLALADVSRIWERIQALKEAHRARDWDRALFLYPEIRRGLTHIRSRYPDLPDADSDKIRFEVDLLDRMEQAVDRANRDVLRERVSEFNGHLTEIPTLLDELESRLQQSS